MYKQLNIESEQCMNTRCLLRCNKCSTTFTPYIMQKLQKKV